MVANMEYLSFNQAMKARFGTKVYKLALDGGMTCPNRDGTLGRKGCIFCSDVGSGDFAAPRCGDVSAQLAAAKAKVAQKNSNGKYIFGATKPRKTSLGRAWSTDHSPGKRSVYPTGI